MYVKYSRRVWGLPELLQRPHVGRLLQDLRREAIGNEVLPSVPLQHFMITSNVVDDQHIFIARTVSTVVMREIVIIITLLRGIIYSESFLLHRNIRINVTFILRYVIFAQLVSLYRNFRHLKVRPNVCVYVNITISVCFRIILLPSNTSSHGVPTYACI